jgi:hypothetical protein
VLVSSAAYLQRYNLLHDVFESMAHIPDQQAGRQTYDGKFLIYINLL